MTQGTWTEISRQPPLVRAQMAISSLHLMLSSRLFKLDRSYRRIYHSRSTHVIVSIFLSDDRQDMIRLATNSENMSVKFTSDNEALLPELHQAMSELMEFVDDYRQHMMIEALSGNNIKPT